VSSSLPVYYYRVWKKSVEKNLGVESAAFLNAVRCKGFKYLRMMSVFGDTS
jgi:hypothetical protein